MAKKKSPARWLLLAVRGDEISEYNYALAELDGLLPLIAKRRKSFDQMMKAVPEDRPSHVEWFNYLVDYGNCDIEGESALIAFAARPDFEKKSTEIDQIVLTDIGFRFTAAPKHDDSGTSLTTETVRWDDWDAWLAGKACDAIKGPHPALKRKGK